MILSLTVLVFGAQTATYWFAISDTTLTQWLLAPSYVKAQAHLENHQQYREGKEDDGGIDAIRSVVVASCYPKRIPTIIKAIDWLMERGARPTSPRDEGAILAAAASDPSGAVLGHLIKKGARPHSDSFALWNATWVLSPANVKLLLNSGADPNKSWGRSENSERADTTLRFKVDDAEWIGGGWKQWLRTSPLMVSSFGNDPASVKLLLSYKANPNAVQPDSGSTALHFAARGNYPEIVQMLLKAGAKKNLKNNRGETPLAVARRFKATKVIPLLR
jgi:hypothetical protein